LHSPFFPADQISEGEQELSDRCQEVNKLNCQLDQAQLEIVEYVTKVAKLEGEQNKEFNYNLL